MINLIHKIIKLLNIKINKNKYNNIKLQTKFLINIKITKGLYLNIFKFQNLVSILS